jgi:hypothetical protein
MLMVAHMGLAEWLSLTNNNNKALIGFIGSFIMDMIGYLMGDNGTCDWLPWKMAQFVR